MAAKLWVSSSAPDADIFVTVRVFDPDGNEVSFVGAVDPNAPAAIGWLRLSHRQLDGTRSEPGRPWHPHTTTLEVMTGAVYECDVEIWPTCLVLPPGYVLAVTISGRDYRNDSLPPIVMSNFKNQMTGCGPFLHDDPIDRPALLTDSTLTVHCGGTQRSRLIVPIVGPA